MSEVPLYDTVEWVGNLGGSRFIGVGGIHPPS